MGMCCDPEGSGVNRESLVVDRKSGKKYRQKHRLVHLQSSDTAEKAFKISASLCHSAENWDSSSISQTQG
jgi:hypothetical protein